MTFMIGFIVFLFLALVSVVGLVLHLGRDKKTRCNNCSQTVSSSQIVCNHCGVFLEKKLGNGSKAIKNMERSVDHKLTIPMEKMGHGQKKDKY